MQAQIDAMLLQAERLELEHIAKRLVSADDPKGAAIRKRGFAAKREAKRLRAKIHRLVAALNPA